MVNDFPEPVTNGTKNQAKLLHQVKVMLLPSLHCLRYAMKGVGYMEVKLLYSSILDIGEWSASHFRHCWERAHQWIG